MIFIAGFYLDYFFDNMPLTDLTMFILAVPVIYHLTHDLFVKDKSTQNKALKIYSFAYVCIYVLWCLIDIVGFAFTMGNISGLMAYMLYLSVYCFLPLCYIFWQKTYSLKAKAHDTFLLLM